MNTSAVMDFPYEMHVLVTGANGFIGKSLCADLLETDYKVTRVVRSKNIELQDLQLIDSIDEKTEWKNILIGVNVVIHLAARVHVLNSNTAYSLSEFRKINVEGTLNLARQAAQSGVKRFIFISSVKVNGECNVIDKPFTEVDIANPSDPYAISKYEAEQGLLQIAQQSGMEVVIIRPSLVYGPGVESNFANMLHLLQRGVPLPLGGIHNKRSFVYVGNLVSLILRCIEHPSAANQTFLVSDGYDLSTTELLQACARALQIKVRLLPISPILLKFFAIILGKKEMVQKLCDNLQIDISKARHLLKWTPPISVEDGLKVTAKSLIKEF